jgi:hypothetical protein
MPSEKIIVITPDKHKVSVRLNQIADDIWDTTLRYASQVHRVGKFKGKKYAIEAATRRAMEIADATPASPEVAPMPSRPAKGSSSDPTRKAKKK